MSSVHWIGIGHLTKLLSTRLTSLVHGIEASKISCMLIQYRGYFHVLGYASDLGNNHDIVLTSGFNYNYISHAKNIPFWLFVLLQ